MERQLIEHRHTPATRVIHDSNGRKDHDSVIAFRYRLLEMTDTHSPDEMLCATLDEAELLTGSSIGFVHLPSADHWNTSQQLASTNTVNLHRQEERSSTSMTMKEDGIVAEALRECSAVIRNGKREPAELKKMASGDVTMTRELAVPITRNGRVLAVVIMGNKAEDYGQVDARIVHDLMDTAWDIVARKRAELSEIMARNELFHLQNMALIGKQTGGIAHDFNNMLCVIICNTEMALANDLSDGPLKNSLQDILIAARHSADLTRKLLASARKQLPKPELIDINAIIEGTFAMLKRLIGERIELVWIPGWKLLPVTIDPSYIDRFLANLCVNARDAITGTGHITIETENITVTDSPSSPLHSGIAPGKYMMLSVTDDGCGIEEKDAPQIFEPFFTLKKEGEGTGFGLYSVYGIVKQCGGFMNFTSESGKGTQFRIYLQ